MFSFQAKFFDQEIAKLTCRTNRTEFIDFGTFRGTFNKAPAIENNIRRWSKKFINTRSVKNPNTSRPLDQHYQKKWFKTQDRFKYKSWICYFHVAIWIYVSIVL